VPKSDTSYAFFATAS